MRAEVALARPAWFQARTWGNDSPEMELAKVTPNPSPNFPGCDSPTHMQIEIASLKRIEHPNLIPFEDLELRDPAARHVVCVWGAPPCDGQPIGKMGQRTRVKADVVWGYIRDIAKGLDCLHANHFAHRNLSFESCIVGQDGVVCANPARPDHPAPRGGRHMRETEHLRLTQALGVRVCRFG